MVESFPPELGQFVHEQIAAGKYHSEQELVVDAVRFLRDVEARQEQFREDVRLGVEQIGRGEFVEYDDQGLREFFEQLKGRARDLSSLLQSEE